MVLEPCGLISGGLAGGRGEIRATLPGLQWKAGRVIRIEIAVVFMRRLWARAMGVVKPARRGH
jgi:hypothetical protein